MKFLGIVLSILGCLSAMYGVNLNNSFEAQFTHFLTNGTKDPGTTWIFIGIILAILGVAAIFKKSNESDNI